MTPTHRKKNSRLLLFVKASPVCAMVLLAACASAPIPVVPDGSNRVPVNDPARISKFQQQSEQEIVAVGERIALQNQVSLLTKQVEDLRSVVRSALLLQSQVPVQVVASIAPVKPAPTPAPVPAPVATPAAAPVATPAAAPVAAPVAVAVAAPVAVAVTGGIPVFEAPEKTIQKTLDGVIVRQFHQFGKFEFNPSTELAEALRTVAPTAKVVNVSGYTDSQNADPANNYVAAARALSAKRWLVANGVSSDRIRSRFEGAGNFLVDNSTKPGRALNRRVELEIKGGENSSLVAIQEKGNKS